MIFFIIGVVAALFALAVLLLAKEYKNSAIIPAVVAVVMIGISCVSYVPTGYTGIVTTFGKVEDGTKDAGIVFKQPWQSIVKMDNRVQEMSMDLSAFSSDIQEVATSVSVGYRINQANAMTIYKSVGKKYEDTLITPRVLETVKAVVAHYDASSLISNRDAVAAQMDAKLREVLAEYNIDLQYISVTNFDFTDTFTDAVEAKNVIAIATADDLTPLQGEFANSAYMAFYLRTSSQGEKYIVVKDGFSVRAAIMQPDVKEALRDSLLEALTLLRVEGLKDSTVDITRQCWPTGGNEETEADDDEN